MNTLNIYSYDSFVPELEAARFKARAWCHDYNTGFPSGGGGGGNSNSQEPNFRTLTDARARMLRECLGHVGDDEVLIEPPFRVDYGCNIRIGKRFYANFNLTILDCALVTIGDRVMFGPNISILSATHETDGKLLSKLILPLSIIFREHICFSKGVAGPKT